MIIKVSAQAAKRDEQRQMEQDFDEAGIVRVPSSTPPFFLVADDDVKEIVAIAAVYRCKPAIALADEDDAPEAAEGSIATEDVLAFIHRLDYTFNWDEDMRLWCVSGIRDGYPDETPDEPAASQRQAAFEALRYLVS